MSLDRRTVQRIITELEKAQLLDRINRFNKHDGRQSNAYSLKKLVLRLNELASEFLAADEAARTERKRVEQRKKTGPELKVVK